MTPTFVSALCTLHPDLLKGTVTDSDFAALDQVIRGTPAEAPGTQAAKHALGPVDGSRAMLDAMRHATRRTRDAGRGSVEKAGLAHNAQFFAALGMRSMGQALSGAALDGDLAASGSDFEALGMLRRLAYAAQVGAPKQSETRAEAAG